MKAINAQRFALIPERVSAVTYPRPFFARGAYTASDNAPARKQGSGYARLALLVDHSDQEPVGTGRRPEKNVVVLFQDDILFVQNPSQRLTVPIYSIQSK